MISFDFHRFAVLALSSLWIAIGSGCAKSPPDATRGRPLEPLYAAQAECLPSFPDDQDWYGGDAAYSVPLPIDEGRTSVWLFGDSFVAQAGSGNARAYPFIHNSIGLSHCGMGGIWRIETYWRYDDEGLPRAFFQPDPHAAWVLAARDRSDLPPYYWPLDGVVLGDTLFVALLRVEHAEPQGPFNLPFRLAGVDLARIANFRDDPDDWFVRISILSNDRAAFPGATFVVTPTHLHAFAFVDDEQDGSPRILSRIPLTSLEGWQWDLSGELETLTVGGTWKSGFRPQDAAILMADAASEMSVHFDEEAARWVAAYSDLAPRTSVDSPLALRTRHSLRLSGPWSEPETLVEIPETRPDDPRSRDENLFCYAGKAHPQFSTTDQLLVTYVCNLFARDPANAFEVLERLRVSPDLYRPRALRIPSTQ